VDTQFTGNANRREEEQVEPFPAADINHLSPLLFCLTF
jgi:hypothetical protein